MSSMDHLLDSLVGKDIQIKFKHETTPHPLGPGKLERLELEDMEHAYKLLVPASAPTGQHTKPQMFVMPILFTADSILWASTGPLTQEGEPAVITPGNGSRTPSGLHIPGR